MWRPNTVGEVFAERRLKFTKGRRVRNVSFTIGRPVKGPVPGDPWWCPTYIEAPIDKFHAVAGEDSLQCLVLALRWVEETLPTLAREHGGRIEWAGEHERLVFSGTWSNVVRWKAVSNLVNGLVDAVTELDNSGKAPKRLSQRLRALVASQGATETARSPSRRPRRDPR